MSETTPDLMQLKKNGNDKSNHATYGVEVCTSCHPLDRFSFRWLMGLRPNCLLISVASFSLIKSTCRRVWISSSICGGIKHTSAVKPRELSLFVLSVAGNGLAKSRVTFASSVRRWSTSSSVRSEGEHPFVEKLTGDEGPPKPIGYGDP